MRSLLYECASGAALDFCAEPYKLLSVSGLGSPGGTVVSAKAPNQDGVTVLGMTLSERMIVVQGAILDSAYDEAGLAAARRNLARLLSGKAGTGRILYGCGGKQFAIQAIPVGSPVFGVRVWNSPYVSFAVRFECPDPYWEDVDESVATASYYGTRLEFPDSGFEFDACGCEVSSVLNPQGMAVTITNDGDADAPIVLRFQGPAKNPVVRNRRTGEFIQIMMALGVHESITIGTAFGAKEVTLEDEGVVSSGMQYLNLDSSFLRLGIGENVLEFIDEGVNEGSEARITYRRKYLGV